ncbi:ankyrin repeat-containing domain protein [Hypoxylon sp. NC1633]|nr:ankyrin repeat-containing domain protein [Hypoxylon sp. NC1633]
MEVELDGKAILSCLQFAIHKALKPYPEVVIACSSLTTTEPSSLTETGLLSSCLVQILNQHPSSSSWLGAFSNRLSSTLRIPNVELRVRTLWQCLRLVFTHTSDCRGLWLIHTTGSPEQRQLLLKVAKRLRYFEELDQIGWKVIIISNSASKIDFPPSKALSRVTLSLDVLRDSIEKDVQSQLDDAIRATPSLMNAKDTALQLLRKHDFNHKFFEFFGDSLWLTSPPIPDVLANLADAFSSVETGLHTIFERVPTQYRTWARKVLEVVCFSFRPMTTSELAIAVAAIDCQSFDQLQRNIDLGTADHIQRLLPGILLVHIGKIYVLHEELELFLRQSESDAWYHIGDCHMKMAKSHFNYLSLILETFGNVETLMVKVIIRDRRQARDAPGSLEDGFFENQALELAPYAALYWYDHYVLARNAEKASSEPPTWSPEPPFLKEMLALRSYGKWRPDRDIDLYWELSQLHLEQAPNMSQFEAFEMAVEVIERRPGDAYIDLMYFPTPSASDVPIRDWVRSNLPLLSIPEIIASHPRVLDVLLEHDRVMMLDCLPDILVSIVSRNDPAFLVDFLRKLDGQVDIREASRRALAFAVVWDMVDIARLLLSYRIIPPEAFRMEPNEVALLHTAVTTGDVEMVQLVLSVGAEPNVLSQGALLGIAATPLHIACRLGLERIVRLLLDAGADVNFSDVNNKITALHVASSRGFPSICKLLIDHGAIISLDSDGQTPLHLPARYSRIPRYKRTATLLLEALKKQFPRFREGGSEGDSEDAKALKAVINAQYGRKKKTALIYAAVAGDVELATSLIDLGADLYSIEDEEHTAAARAAMMNDADMVRCLLDSGTDVDWTSSDGRSILHDACVWGSTSVIELLLERGALIDRLDTDNVPPIAVAATWNLLRTVRQMASRCSKVSTSLALILAARYGYYRVAVELLAAGADINHQDEFGNTPLQFSCWNSSPRVTELFLTRMVDINRSDKDNITALADAARRGGMECLKLLLDAGADTEIASLSGKTAREYIPISLLCFAGASLFRSLLETFVV